MEMKWEFTSWGEWGPLGSQGFGVGLLGRPPVTPVHPAVPLVSKMCPSDVYRVWKRGESLRVDTSLLGFEHMTWQRGRRSFIFKGQGELWTHSLQHLGPQVLPRLGRAVLPFLSTFQMWKLRLGKEGDPGAKADPLGSRQLRVHDRPLCAAGIQL